jgi:hypothetical protein
MLQNKGLNRAWSQKSQPFAIRNPLPHICRRQISSRNPDHAHPTRDLYADPFDNLCGRRSRNSRTSRSCPWKNHRKSCRRIPVWGRSTAGGCIPRLTGRHLAYTDCRLRTRKCCYCSSSHSGSPCTSRPRRRMRQDSSSNCIRWCQRRTLHCNPCRTPA